MQGEVARDALALTPDPAPSSRKPQTVKTTMPNDWRPSVLHYEQAKTEGGQDRAWVDREAQAMRDWAAAGGERCVDWDARFRNWIRRGLDKPRINGSAHQPGKCTPVRPIEEILAAGEAKKAREQANG